MEMQKRRGNKTAPFKKSRTPTHLSREKYSDISYEININLKV